MSNTRKIRAPKPATVERCTFCGRRLGRGSALKALRLRTGQVACARCRETGSFQKLACGHVALPGALMINESGDGKTFVCRACAGRAQITMISDFEDMADVAAPTGFAPVSDRREE